MSVSAPPEISTSKALTQRVAIQRIVVLFAVFVVLALFFRFVAQHRFIDGDEGAYLLASRLALSHKTPYLDFFWNQAPLLPYAYGIWLKLGGVSWASGRMFSVLLSAILGVVLFGDIYRQTRHSLAALAGTILFAFSTMVFAWYSVVKTHGLASVLLFGSYAVLTGASSVSARRLTVVAGILFGLSVDTRSYLLLLFPVFAWWIAKEIDTENPWPRLWSFAAGFVVGTLPSIYLFLRSPDIFLFDNLLYHSIRSSEGLIGWWGEKLVLVVQLFLGSSEGNGLQWSILFFVSAGLISSTARRSSCRLAFRIAIFLALICLLPTPTYLQYFSLCVPFLIVSAVCVVDDLFNNLETKAAKLGLVIASSLVVLVYVAVSVKDLRNYLYTGDGVPGLRLAHDRGDWKIDRVVAVSDVVSKYANPGDVAASFWPGDIFQTPAEPLPGIENPFALPIADKLTAEQRARYHILSADDILAALAARKPKVVVLRDQILAAVTADEFQRMQGLVQQFRSALVADGYTLVQTIGGISIYVYRSKP
jgi:hypothetical protein